MQDATGEAVIAIGIEVVGEVVMVAVMDVAIAETKEVDEATATEVMIAEVVDAETQIHFHDSHAGVHLPRRNQRSRRRT